MLCLRRSGHTPPFPVRRCGYPFRCAWAQLRNMFLSFAALLLRSLSFTVDASDLEEFAGEIYGFSLPESPYSSTRGCLYSQAMVI